MAENKTKLTEASVENYFSAIADKPRREDCQALAKLMTKATKYPPKMWGASIAGFGSYHYKYDSGREGDSCLTGFSSRKGDISLSRFLLGMAATAAAMFRLNVEYSLLETLLIGWYTNLLGLVVYMGASMIELLANTKGDFLVQGDLNKRQWRQLNPALTPMEYFQRHHQWPLRLAVASSALIAVAGCATSSQPPVAPPAQRFTHPVESLLDGIWEGRLKLRQPLTATQKDKPPDASDLVLRVSLQGTVARVYLLDGGQWTEAMPGGFQVMRRGSNAIVSAISGNDADGKGWIESWSILLTVENDNAAVAEWTRAVNNLMPSSNALPTFSMGAVGEVHRIAHSEG
jgi:hypothetical protein